MTFFDIFIAVALFAVGIGVVIYVERLARKAGRDRPFEPGQLKRFHENAPFHRRKQKSVADKEK